MAFKRIFLLLFALLATAAPVRAAALASEQAVRAAMVFNFLKFTEWPAATASEPQLRLCIAANDPQQIAALEALAGRSLRGKPLVAARFGGKQDCDVIYVDSPQRWSEISADRSLGHALTIGSYAGFARDGGMIEIFLHEGSTRFDIDLGAAKRAELRLYPELLRLARKIFE